MKSQNKLLAHVTLMLLICTNIITSCNSDNDEASPEPDTFEAVLARGGDTIEDLPQARETDTLNVEETVTEDIPEQNEGGGEVTNRYICTKKTLSVLDGNGSFPMFNPNADVIYPGSLLQGKTLQEPTPSIIPVKRAGGVISYDLNNGNLTSSFPVESVSKDQVQNAMNQIIDGAVQSGNVVPSNFQLDIVEVQSESQLAMELGLKVETFASKAKANLSYNTDQRYNSFLVKLTQSYYTMSYTIPTSVDELFHEDVTPQQLSTYVAEDNPATFISSVTYGRIFYMLIESTSSSREMNAKLDVSYGSFGNKASGSVDVDAFNSLQNTKIKIIAYGGDAQGTFELTGETSINAVANKLAESTDIRAGLPLSYVVRSVERPDKIVGTRIATEYDVVECELRGSLPPVGFRSLVDLFDDGIGAMVNVSGSNIVLFNKAGDQYAWYNGNSGDVLGTYSVADPDGPMGLTSLAGVGAMVRFAGAECFDDVTASEANRLYVFDQTGLKCEIFVYDAGAVSGNTLPSGPIGSYRQEGDANRIYLVNEIFGDSDDFGFANIGYEAAVRTGHGSMAYFGKPGERYALYNRTSPGSWGSIKDNSQWYEGRCEAGTGLLFDKIGAATTISFGGSSCQYLFVNEAGDELMTWFTDCRNQGPWIIR